MRALRAAAVLVLCLSAAVATSTASARSRGGPTLRLSPTEVKAGEPIVAVAGPFTPGEYVKIFDSYVLSGTVRTSPLVGGAVDSRGYIRFERDTLEAFPGAHRLCVVGVRSGGVACAFYVVTGGLKSGGGYTTPKSGGGWTPPKSGGGYTTPTSSGTTTHATTTTSGWAPPKSGGGYTTPKSGGGSP